MATGILGSADLSAATDTTLYTVPSDTFAVVTVSFCNRTASAVTVRLSASASSTPTGNEYLEYETTIPANGVLERTGIVLQAGKLLVVRSSSITVSAVAYGIETSLA